MLRLTKDACAVLDPGPFVPCAQLCSKAQAEGVGEELGERGCKSVALLPCLAQVPGISMAHWVTCKYC